MSDFPQSLGTEQFTAGSKRFYIDLKRNARGLFIQVTEKSATHGHKDRIMVPLAAAKDFAKAFARLATMGENGA